MLQLQEVIDFMEAAKESGMTEACGLQFYGRSKYLASHNSVGTVWVSYEDKYGELLAYICGVPEGDPDAWRELGETIHGRVQTSREEHEIWKERAWAKKGMAPPLSGNVKRAAEARAVALKDEIC